VPGIIDRFLRRRPDPVAIARKLERLLGKGRVNAAKSLIGPFHPADVADVIERLPTELKPEVFGLLDNVDKAADVMLELDEESLSTILADLDRRELADLIKKMESDDAADVIAQLKVNQRSKVIEELPVENRTEVTELLKYPENSAGGRMRMEFVALPDTDTVVQAAERVRSARPQAAEPPVAYVVDREGKLDGYISLRDLLRNPADALVREVMRPVQAFARVLDDQEEVARIARRYDFSTVPVVDESGRLTGIITADDILDVVVEEASEDIAKLGQTMDMEEALGPVGKSVSGRVPWLFISLSGGILASFVVLIFQNTLRALVVVATFMPIVAGMGGAAGNQVTNIVVRALALGEVTPHDIGRLIWKQVRVGMIAGAATGTLAALVALVLHGSPLLGLVVLMAIALNVTVGSSLGALTPMIFAHFGKDPALASSLLLTATTDMIGLFILLGLTTLALHFFTI